MYRVCWRCTKTDVIHRGDNVFETYNEAMLFIFLNRNPGYRVYFAEPVEAGYGSTEASGS